MSSKVVEAHAKIHSLAMAVAVRSRHGRINRHANIVLCSLSRAGYYMVCERCVSVLVRGC